MTSDSRRKAKRKYARKRREFVRDAKEVPCMDCGVEYPHYVMEFDHIRGEKSFNLGGTNGSLERLQAEIDKCDIVCANCHRVRTWERHWSQRIIDDGP